MRPPRTAWALQLQPHRCPQGCACPHALVRDPATSHLRRRPWPLRAISLVMTHHLGPRPRRFGRPFAAQERSPRPREPVERHLHNLREETTRETMTTTATDPAFRENACLVNVLVVLLGCLRTSRGRITTLLAPAPYRMRLRPPMPGQCQTPSTPPRTTFTWISSPWTVTKATPVVALTSENRHQRS